MKEIVEFVAETIKAKSGSLSDSEVNALASTVVAEATAEVSAETAAEVASEVISEQSQAAVAAPA